MLPVLLRDYLEWKSPLHEAETLFYYALGKERIEREANLICAPYGCSAELLPSRRVGVQGDNRTYCFSLLINGSWSTHDEKILGMARKIAEKAGINDLPENLAYGLVAEELASRITREVRDVNTVIMNLVNP